MYKVTNIDPDMALRLHEWPTRLSWQPIEVTRTVRFHLFLSVTSICDVLPSEVWLHTQPSAAEVFLFVSGIAQSVYSDTLHSGRSEDRIPVGERFSAPVQNGPGAHTASCTMNIGFLSGGKADGARRWPHHRLVPKLKRDLRYTSTAPLGLCGFSLGMFWSP